MELNLDALHLKALQLSKTIADITLNAERVRGAKHAKKLIVETTTATLQNFNSLRESGNFSDKELAEMLGNACLKMASFLFSAGALPHDWRDWCGLAGLAFYIGKDFSYSMQLLTIARAEMDSEVSEALNKAELKSYREQAIQFVIFCPRNRRSPSLSPIHALDEYYASVLRSLELSDRRGLARSVKKIVEFWLNETSDERFDPGIFPVFEPEINSTVAALNEQGFDLKFRSPRIKNFLGAVLE